MAETYIISDTHLGHANSLTFLREDRDDLLESLRCACNYIDKLGGVSQQYRAMLASLEAKPTVPDGFVWPDCPKRRQSHVLFDDGYEEGWAACVATIKAMTNTTQGAKP